MTTDEALKQLRETWPSNPGFIDKLQDRLNSAHPIPLVPFIGAGLSIPVGFESWSAFLTRLANDCGQSAAVAALLSASKYEEAAEPVEQELSPTIFHELVTSAYGERKSKAGQLRGAILALPDLASGPVVTTNFDRILERVFAEANAPFEHVVWGSQVDSIQRAIAENKPFLLKIHGDAEERSNRVLTKREYDKHYAFGDPEGLRAQLGRVFQGRTLLFLGCSLGPDRTMEVLLEALKHVSGQAHYALLAKPATKDELYPRQQWLGKRGILPIWFPTGEYGLIEPFLRWLASLQPSLRIPAPELVLERPAQRRHDLRSELDLLISYQRTTEFIGREAEFTSLQTWLHSAAPVSVRVLTGKGGSGKTRLGVELIESLEAGEPGQWNCGFLTLAEMERFSILENLSRWQRRKPVLAVLDYAAGSAGKLRVWLEQLSAADPAGEKLRLLLLEREASWDEGWLASSATRGYSATAVRALFDPPEPVQLPPIPESVDRRTILRATVHAGASFRGVTPPRIPAQSTDESFDRRIADPLWGDPLTLMMAGLTALETGFVEALSLGRMDLAFRLADRELSRLDHFGNDAPRGLMQHMTAYVTVSGGLSRDELLPAAKAESGETGWHHPGGWRTLADCVGEAMHGSDGARPVEPDVIGEALLLRVWGGNRTREGSQAVVRAAKSRSRQVAASVMRAAMDFCVGEKPRQEPLEWLDALIEQGKRDPELLWVIERQLPHQTLALREPAVDVDSLLAAHLRERGDSSDSAPERARILNNLALRLRDLDRREEALEQAQEAVRLRSELAQQSPDAFLPDLAGSLNNLAMMLSDLGRPEEALEQAHKAVRLRQELAQQSPDTFLPDLAGSLNNLAMMLSDLGRPEEALEQAQKAVRLYHQLAQQRPDVFLPDLAMSLNNLAMTLSDLDRREEALEQAQEAARLYHQLAQQRPDAFLPDFAMSLNNLANRLSDLDRREEALEQAQEAVRLYHQLAQQRPDAFLPDFAMSLNNLANRLSDLDRREEALEQAQEAVRLYRQLAQQRPDAFLPDLAISLNNLANVLSNLGRREKALEQAQEAIRIRRRLAQQRPDAFLPDLARSLAVSADILAKDNPASAIAPIEEAVRVLTPFFLRLPQAHAPLMRAIRGIYLQATESAHTEPDGTLLAPVAAIFAESNLE